MKKLNLRLGYALCIVLVAVLGSCSNDDNKSIYSTYETFIEIKYEDNSIDTIYDAQKVYYRNRLTYEIETSIIGLISITETTPCLIVKNGNKKTKIACYVKRYRILSQAKYSN